MGGFMVTQLFTKDAQIERRCLLNTVADGAVVVVNDALPCAPAVPSVGKAVQKDETLKITPCL